MPSRIDAVDAAVRESTRLVRGVSRRRRSTQVLAVQSLQLDEVNAVARDLMAHVVDFGAPDAARPSAMIACSPAFLADGTPVKIDSEQLLAVAAIVPCRHVGDSRLSR